MGVKTQPNGLRMVPDQKTVRGLLNSYYLALPSTDGNAALKIEGMILKYDVNKAIIGFSLGIPVNEFFVKHIVQKRQRAAALANMIAIFISYVRELLTILQEKPPEEISKVLAELNDMSRKNEARKKFNYAVLKRYDKATFEELETPIISVMERFLDSKSKGVQLRDISPFKLVKVSISEHTVAIPVASVPNKIIVEDIS